MFQPRVVAAIGSALSGIGLILSSMSSQLWEIIVAYGLVGKTCLCTVHLFLFLLVELNFIFNKKMLNFVDVTGLGLGFINPSSFIAVNSYFSTKRGRAIGLALAGTYDLLGR